MSSRQIQNMKSKCHISHISSTNYIFGKTKTLCYIFCNIIFPKNHVFKRYKRCDTFILCLVFGRWTLKSITLSSNSVNFQSSLWHFYFYYWKKSLKCFCLGGKPAVDCVTCFHLSKKEGFVIHLVLIMPPPLQ